MHKFLSYICGILIAVTFAACDTTGPEGNPSGPKTQEPSTNEIKKVLKDVCTDWTLSVEEVSSRMSSQLKVASSEDFLQYSYKSGISVAYSFKEGVLTSACVLVPAESGSDVAKAVTGKYLRLGVLDGAEVSVDIKANTMLICYPLEFDESPFYIISFAPVSSPAFPYKEAETIEINEVSDITYFTAVVSGSVLNLEEKVTLYLYFGTNPDLTIKNAAGKGSVTTTNSFKFTLKNLKMGTKYYYFVTCMVGDMELTSEIHSFTTAETRTYAVGDFWPDSSNREGVVFTVSSDGLSGKVFSLETTSLPWDTDDLAPPYYRSTNKTDGSKNSGPSSSSTAYGWCKHYKDGSWYLPAVQELNTIANNWYINLCLKYMVDNPGYAAFYWSSTEYDRSCAYIVNMDGREQSYTGKSSKRRVIAVKQFSVE